MNTELTHIHSGNSRNSRSGLKFLFAFLLLSNAAGLSAQYYAMASLKGSIAYLHPEKQEIILVDPFLPKKQNILPLPDRHLGRDEPYTTDRLALDRDGEFLYWGYYNEIWRHPVEEHKPVGTWELIMDFPRSQGFVKSFHMNRNGDQMLVFLDLDRQYLTSTPDSVVWNCRSVIHADLSETHADLSDPLIISDSIGCNHGYFIDDDLLVLETWNEKTSKSGNQFYHRTYTNHWEPDTTGLFDEFAIRGDAVGEHYPKYLLLEEYDGHTRYTFAIYDEENLNRKSSQTASKSRWYIEGKKNRISPGFPQRPSTLLLFQAKLSFFGGRMIATEWIKNFEHQQEGCETRIHFPAQPTRKNEFSAYQSINVEGFFHIGPVAHRLVLLDKSNCRGLAHELWLLYLDSGELEFIGIPK
jgi:hypothetical protein